MSFKYKLDNITTEELLKLYEEQPDAVTSEIYRIAGDFVKKYATPADYELQDLIQELTLHAIKVLNKFDHTRGRFSTYLFRVFKNRSTQLFRMSNAQKRGAGQKIERLENPICNGTKLIDLIEDPGISSMDRLLEEEFLEDLKNIVNPWTIEYLKGASEKDLAVKYGITNKVMHMRIKREITKARNKLRDKWQN